MTYEEPGRATLAMLEALSEEFLSCRGKLASSRRAFTPAMVYLSLSNE